MLTAENNEKKKEIKSAGGTLPFRVGGQEPRSWTQKTPNFSAPPRSGAGLPGYALSVAENNEAENERVGP